MQRLRNIKSVLAIGVLLSALSLPVFSQESQDQQDKNQRDRMATTLTGCLNKDTSGSYVLTDASGMKTTVSGAADLEKHSSNHKVTLTGMTKTDASGKPVFEVTKLTHVSDTCTTQ
ncbi:MAG: hypothetical protein JWP63_1448 [Candidatus Solibacter sp.]|jgi:hypothetical protein|nr:hypothetical protein [Candidatus Solibacter sp.]